MSEFLLVGGPWHGRHVTLPAISTQLKLVLETGVVFYVAGGYAGRMEYQPFPH